MPAFILHDDADHQAFHLAHGYTVMVRETSPDRVKTLHAGDLGNTARTISRVCFPREGKRGFCQCCWVCFRPPTRSPRCRFGRIFGSPPCFRFMKANYVVLWNFTHVFGVKLLGIDAGFFSRSKLYS